MVTKHRVTINLDDDDFEALTQLSITADRPLAYLGRLAVRRLVGEELSRREAIPRSVTLGQSGEAK